MKITYLNLSEGKFGSFKKSSSLNTEDDQSTLANKQFDPAIRSIAWNDIIGVYTKLLQSVHRALGKLITTEEYREVRKLCNSGTWSRYSDFNDMEFAWYTSQRYSVHIGNRLASMEDVYFKSFISMIYCNDDCLNFGNYILPIVFTPSWNASYPSQANTILKFASELQQKATQIFKKHLTTEFTNKFKISPFNSLKVQIISIANMTGERPWLVEQIKNFVDIDVSRAMNDDIDSILKHRYALLSGWCWFKDNVFSKVKTYEIETRDLISPDRYGFGTPQEPAIQDLIELQNQVGDKVITKFVDTDIPISVTSFQDTYVHRIVKGIKLVDSTINKGINYKVNITLDDFMDDSEDSRKKFKFICLLNKELKKQNLSANVNIKQLKCQTQLCKFLTSFPTDGLLSFTVSGLKITNANSKYFNDKLQVDAKYVGDEKYYVYDKNPILCNIDMTCEKQVEIFTENIIKHADNLPEVIKSVILKEFVLKANRVFYDFLEKQNSYCNDSNCKNKSLIETSKTNLFLLNFGTNANHHRSKNTLFYIIGKSVNIDFKTGTFSFDAQIIVNLPQLSYLCIGNANENPDTQVDELDFEKAKIEYSSTMSFSIPLDKILNNL